MKWIFLLLMIILGMVLLGTVASGLRHLYDWIRRDKD